MIRWRRCTMLLPLVLASPALALGAAFETECAENVPIATCSCMVQELNQSRDGRLLLAVSDALALPKDRQEQARLDILERYNIKPAEIAVISPKLKPLVLAALERCK